MSTKLNMNISTSLKAKLLKAAADENKNLTEYLHDHLPELLQSGQISLSEDQSSATGPLVVRGRTTNIGERLKAVIADAVETKVYLKTLGIDLGDERRMQQQYPPGYLPYQQPTQPQKPQKDIMTVVAEIKALESLGKQASDPSIKEALKEISDGLKEALKEVAKKPEKTKEMGIEDLMKWMTFYRMAGQPDEAKKVESLLEQRLSKFQEDLHDTQMSLQKQESDFQVSNLQREIREIRNAPSQFDQIVRISQLSEADPAIKAYVYKKLDIKDKEALTPEKLGEYIKNVQVPLGEILDGVIGFIQKQRGAAPQPPQPQTAPPERSEEQIAKKALPPGLLRERQTGEKSMSTFTIEKEPPKPPSEAKLPPEEEQPSSEGGEKK